MDKPRSIPRAGLLFFILEIYHLLLADRQIDHSCDLDGTRISKLVGKTTTYYVNGANGATEIVTSDAIADTQRINVWGNSAGGALPDGQGSAVGGDLLGHLKDCI